MKGLLFNSGVSMTNDSPIIVLLDIGKISIYGRIMRGIVSVRKDSILTTMNISIEGNS